MARADRNRGTGQNSNSHFSLDVQSTLRVTYHMLVNGGNAGPVKMWHTYNKYTKPIHMSECAHTHQTTHQISVSILP